MEPGVGGMKRSRSNVGCNATEEEKELYRQTA